MGPVTALIMLAGIFYGTQYGGTITSVLMRVPGESASVVTMFDGNPLAKRGKAGVALGIAAIGSFIGGTFSVIGLMVFGPPLANTALMLGPAEYFSLMIMALSLVVAFAGESIVRGLIATCLGLMLAMVGQDIMTGQPRLTFDFRRSPRRHRLSPRRRRNVRPERDDRVLRKAYAPGDRQGGSRFLQGPAIDQRLEGVVLAHGPGNDPRILRGDLSGRRTDDLFVSLLRHRTTDLQESGAIRKRGDCRSGGTGDRQQRGHGRGHDSHAQPRPSQLSLDGAHARRPHHVWSQPGPTLFSAAPDVVWGLIGSMYVGNVMLVVINLACIPLIVALMDKVRGYLPIIILLLSAFGVYSYRSSVFDIGIMLLFALIGYGMTKVAIPLAPVILGLLLGGPAENSLRQALVLSDGNPMTFFTRPIAATFLVMTCVSLVLPVLLRKRKE